MKEVDDDDGHEDSEVRVSSASLGDLMRREAEESPCTSSGVRCWQPGEVEVEDRWGISSEQGVPPVRAAALDKSKSRQLHGSRRSLYRVGRRVFSCFRHSTIRLTVPGLEPSTPPKSGPLTAPRKSASGANGVTFLHEATDHRHHGDDDEDGESEEPTSPVVNCMGQVRPKQRCCKKVEAPAPATPKESFMDDREKFRRTKSQAPSMSPSMVSKSKSCKWKQLLRSNSSSISPSNHPCGSELGEPEIDLGRFSSASASHSDSQSKMRRRSEDTSKPPDRTCMLMRRSHSGRSSDDNKLLDLRNAEDGSDSEPVFRVLPSLKTTMIESPKWLADETLVNKRQGFCKRSSSSKYTHV